MKKLFSLALFGLVAAGWGAPLSSFTSTTVDAPAISRSQILSRLSSISAYQLNVAELQDKLLFAPVEVTGTYVGTPVRIALPLAGGSVELFDVVEQPLLSPAMQQKYPDIKTYSFQGVTDRTKTGRFGFTVLGFHAIILGGEKTTYIDPAVLGEGGRVVVYSKDQLDPAARSACYLADTLDSSGSGDGDMPFDNPTDGQNQLENNTGAERQTYRLAITTTGEYSNFFGSNDGTGTAAANAAVVQSVNRVSGVYERDLAIRLNLVFTKCYTNATTDPFDNASPGALLTQNQATLDSASVLGNANYDIGHNFSTGGGGVATLNAVRVATSKARGITGSPSPTADAFDIDYVAHEMGHQFGGNHTFNGTAGNCGGGNRNAATAYETGSGTTIMAYAGICSTDDVQSNSDAFFHIGSYAEIVATRNFMKATPPANSALVFTATGNTPPVINTITANNTIPQSTPFKLTASASDINADSLTYCWEQFDAGSPLFRSLPASTSGTRVFPPLANVLANSTAAFQTLPTTNRTMAFKVSVRDNRANGGGYAYNATNVTITSSGAAFTISSPASALTWNAGTTQTITWNIGGTSAASPVRILLSTSGGNDYISNPGGLIVLANSTANDGSEPIQVPWVSNTATARIIIEPVTGSWFRPAVSNVSIVESTQWSVSNPANVSGGLSTNGSVNLNNPASTGGVTFTLSSNNAAATVPVTVTVPAGSTSVSVPVTTTAVASNTAVTINATRNGTTRPMTFTILANQAPTANNDSYNVAYGVATTINAPGVLANDTDPESNALTAQKITNPVKGSVTVNPNGSFTYTPNLGATGTDSFTYRANDGSSNSGNATVTLTIAAPPTISGILQLEDLSVDELGKLVTFELRSVGSSTPLQTYNVVLGLAGTYSFSVSNLALGNYAIAVKDTTFLRGQVSPITLGAGAATANFSLKNGDVDGDNEVTILDYLALSNAFETQIGDAGYVAACDLDKDGTVSILDYLILSANFELQGAP